jgi:hypothetical protein
VTRPAADDREQLVAAYPKRRMSGPTAHRWWYPHTAAAGLVGEGMTSGLNMHRALTHSLPSYVALPTSEPPPRRWATQTSPPPPRSTGTTT